MYDTLEICADAGFHAAMKVDMFCRHRSQYWRQQPLAAARIRASGMSLTNWMPGPASLLAPIHGSRFRPVLGDPGEIDFPFRLCRESGIVTELFGAFEWMSVSDGNQEHADFTEVRGDAVTYASRWSNLGACS